MSSPTTSPTMGAQFLEGAQVCINQLQKISGETMTAIGQAIGPVTKETANKAFNETKEQATKALNVLDNEMSKHVDSLSGRAKEWATKTEAENPEYRPTAKKAAVIVLLALSIYNFIATSLGFVAGLLFKEQIKEMANKTENFWNEQSSFGKVVIGTAAAIITFKALPIVGLGYTTAAAMALGGAIAIKLSESMPQVKPAS